MWADPKSGRPFRDVLRESARAEFEAARGLTDPEEVTRMLVVSRDALDQALEKARPVRLSAACPPPVRRLSAHVRRERGGQGRGRGPLASPCCAAAQFMAERRRIIDQEEAALRSSEAALLSDRPQRGGAGGGGGPHKKKR